MKKSVEINSLSVAVAAFLYQLSQVLNPVFRPFLGHPYSVIEGGLNIVFEQQPDHPEIATAEVTPESWRKQEGNHILLKFGRNCRNWFCIQGSLVYEIDSQKKLDFNFTNNSGVNQFYLGEIQANNALTHCLLAAAHDRWEALGKEGFFEKVRCRT